jgi:hypothetical protein
MMRPDPALLKAQWGIAALMIVDHDITPACITSDFVVRWRA